jgi:hypothetical protein
VNDFRRVLSNSHENGALVAIALALRDSCACDGPVVAVSRGQPRQRFFESSSAGLPQAELIPGAETELARFNTDVRIEAQLVFVGDDVDQAAHATYRRHKKKSGTWQGRSSGRDCF